MPATEISELAIGVKPSLSRPELRDVQALVSEAQWNQLAADWRLFQEHGRIYAAATPEGKIVATTATLPYGAQFAWISMVLVAGPYRRRGLASLLMRRAIDDLCAADLVPVLDATPDGRAVYRGLGFTDLWGFQRFKRQARQDAGESLPGTDVTLHTLQDQDWPAVCAMDTAAFGASRAAVLAHMRERLPAAAMVGEQSGRLAGFMLGRDGRVAAHLGPVIAETDAAACALLAHALAAIDGPVFVDLGDAKTQVRTFLEQRGFAPVRPFTRMAYRHSTRFDDPIRTVAVVGPEFG